MIFDAHYGYDMNSAFSVQPGADQNLGWTVMQIPGLSTAGQAANIARIAGGLPRIAFDTGFSLLGSQSQFQPQDYWDPEKNVDANLTWIKGAHNLRFGFDSDFMNSRETQLEQIGSGNVSSAGGFQFNQQTTELCKAAAANGICSSTSSGNEYQFVRLIPSGVVNSGGQIYQLPPNYFSDTKMYSFYGRDQWQVNSCLQ